MRRGHILVRANKDGSRTHYIKYSVNGRPIKKAIGPSRREAERALTAALAAVDQGHAPLPSRETFAEAADAWLERKRTVIEASTHRGYEIELRTRLKPEFGHLKLRQLRRSDVEAYISRLDAEGRLSRKTINDSLIPLRQILGRAVREGTLPRNPAAEADRDDPLKLPYEPPSMLYLNRDDARRYLSACRPSYGPLAEVLIGAGLRIGEAVALEWRDVDWDASALRISRTVKHGGIGTPKGDRARTVLIAAYLLEVLAGHRLRQAESRPLGPLVFTSSVGTMLDRHGVRSRAHRAAVRAAGLSPALRLHDLRHTAATLWLAAGESIYFVQQQLGHKDIQTTIDLYGHPDQAAHRAAADRAASWWRAGAS